MKLFISLIIILPTLIAVLLFTVAAFSFNAPALLAASTSPAVAVCCIIAGALALIPLFAAAFVMINDIKNKKNTSEQKETSYNSKRNKNSGG